MTHGMEMDGPQAPEIAGAEQPRVLDILRRLLEVRASSIAAALDEGADLLGAAFRADTVDVLLYEAATHSLVAVGTGRTPMGRRRHDLGLDRMPLANGGRAVEVFRTGAPHRDGRVDHDAEEVPGLFRGLGIRSEIIVPLDVGEERRGVVLASSDRPEHFSDEDLRFLGTVARWAGLVALRDARAEAEAAVRSRDAVLATVSHDLRNPLTALKGRVQLLRRRLARDPRRADDVATLKGVEAQADLMRRMIDQFVDLSQMQMGQDLPLQRRRVDLVALAEDLVAQYAATTTQHRLDLSGEGHGVLVGCWDPDRLEQVLGNLLTNAIKYSPEGGPVDVTLAKTEDEGGAWARLAVRDLGLGIPAEDQPRLFERFHRGSNVVGRVVGTGIGLAGACQIVRQHGGSIAVESEVGRGSTFVVTLPLAAAGSHGTDCACSEAGA